MLQALGLITMRHKPQKRTAEVGVAISRRLRDYKDLFSWRKPKAERRVAKSKTGHRKPVY